MEWQQSPGFTDYPAALARMEQRVGAIQRGEADELGWFVEHPPLYTLGTSAKTQDVIGEHFPRFESGRGGQVTYHGPGQQVVYLMRDLKKHAGPQGPDLRAYVHDLERWVIATLAHYGVTGLIREGRVGVWVETPGGEAKIAALGVRVQKWVTSHGIALNVAPDLDHYRDIIPCGIREFGVTSLKALGIDVHMDDVRATLRRTFGDAFPA